MLQRTIRATIAAAAVVLLALPASGAAAGITTARFTMQITGVQTTAWSWNGPSYTDCNGTQTTSGDGTEVFRFDNGTPNRLLVTRNLAGAVNFQIGTWTPNKVDVLGDFAQSRLTRHGKITHTWTGGYCGHPQPTDSGPYDCGQRHGVSTVVVDPAGDGRRIEVQVATDGGWKPFTNCPIYTGNGASAFGFTTTYGRLSNKLLFGKQKKIVVEDGKVYRRNDGGVKALSTTHIRIVLIRHR
jgi:hypothetical protein